MVKSKKNQNSVKDMNFNSFTIKSQEAIQKALELTRSAGQQQIEPVHLLKAIMLEGEALVKLLYLSESRSQHGACQPAA